MNINDLTIGQAKRLATMFVDIGTAYRIDEHLIGKPVIIRTFSAGVHFGTLAARNGQEVRLTNTRRVWKWAGAFTLSEVAENGVSSAKMPSVKPEIILMQCIEIIPCSEKAAKQLTEIEAHGI